MLCFNKLVKLPLKYFLKNSICGSISLKDENNILRNHSSEPVLKCGISEFVFYFVLKIRHIKLLS